MHGAAAIREQGAVEPLPRVIAPGAIKRVTASVGRRGLCGLERAAWTGQGSRLREACCRLGSGKDSSAWRYHSAGGANSSHAHAAPSGFMAGYGDGDGSPPSVTR